MVKTNSITAELRMKTEKMDRNKSDVMQKGQKIWHFLAHMCLVLPLLFGLTACGWFGGDELPPAPTDIDQPVDELIGYTLGPLDTISINVWEAPEFSTSVPIRPDGKITLPLMPEIQAAGLQPSELASNLEDILVEFVQEPIVTVSVTSFGGPFDRRIRVVRQATGVQVVSYRQQMTMLDAMIEVGGLSDFDNGNKAKLSRNTAEGLKEYNLRLTDLMRKGDQTKNVPVLPGDTIYIPEKWF